MTDIPYLNASELITAERTNEIWSAFDAKFSAVMDNHSLLFAYNSTDPGGNQSMGRFVGRKFFFIGKNPFWCNQFFNRGRLEPGFVNYNQAIFDEAVAATDVFDYDQVTSTGQTLQKPRITYDVRRSLVRLQYPDPKYLLRAGLPEGSDDFLGWSLKVHKKRYKPSGVKSLRLTNPGSATTYPGSVSVVISGGGGTGAKATATIGIVAAKFVITSLELTDAGRNYTSVPTVTFVNGPDGASAEAVLDDTPEQVFNVLMGYNSAASVVLGNGAVMFPTCEYEHLYDCPELICEGTSAVVIKSDWNKYRFFRCHNFNSAPAEFTFMARKGGTTHLTVSVPAYGSRCVRLNEHDQWIEGYNHFHKFCPGDLRAFDFNSPSGQYFAAQNNNIVNQNLLVILIDWFSRQGRFNLDVTKFWDASGIYCNPGHVAGSKWERKTPDGGYFGNPSSDDTLIGDLIYHKGKLLDIQTSGSNTQAQLVEFNGFGSIVADFAHKGITVTQDADGKFSLSSSESSARELWNFSTNLGFSNPLIRLNPADVDTLGYAACTSWTQTSIINSATSVAIWPAESMLPGSTTPPTGSVSFPLSVLEQRGGLASTIAVPLSDSISNLKDSLQQDDEVATFSSKNVKLTGFGPLFTWTRQTSLKAALGGVQGAQTIFIHIPGYTATKELTGMMSLNDTVLSESGYSFFWKCAAAAKIGGVLSVIGQSAAPIGWPTLNNLLFHSPRSEQFYGHYTAKPGGETIMSPAFQLLPGFYKTTQDFRYSAFDQFPIADSKPAASKSKRKPGISFLSAFNYLGNKLLSLSNWFNGKNTAYPDPLNPALWKSINTSNPDFYRLNRTAYVTNTVADGQGMLFDRFPQTLDTYNNMASLVNSIVSVVPLNFLNVFQDCGSSPGYVLPNIMPFNQYAGGLRTDRVYFIRVTKPGSGYTSLPTITLVGGGGTGAAAISNGGVSGGGLWAITLIDAGSGYTAPPEVVISGGGGTGAEAVAVIGNAFTYLGVPMKSVEDLPGSLAALFKEKNTYQKIKWTFRYHSEVRYYPPPFIDSSGCPSGDSAYQVFSYFDSYERTIEPVNQDSAGVVDGLLLDNDWKMKLFGTTAVSMPTSYSWWTIDDVQSIATALGLRFTYQKLGVPLKLKIFSESTVNFYIEGVEEDPSSFPDFNTGAERPGFYVNEKSYHSQYVNDGNGNFTWVGCGYTVLNENAEQDANAEAAKVPTMAETQRLIPSKFVAFIEDSVDPEWIRDVVHARVKEDWTPQKARFSYAATITESVLSKGGAVKYAFELQPPDEFLMRNWEDYAYRSERLFEPDPSYKCLSVQNYGGGIASVVQFPENTLTWAEAQKYHYAFSPTFFGIYEAIRDSADSVAATLTPPAEDQLVTQKNLSGPVNFISSDGGCRRVMVFWDNRITL